MTGSVTYDFRGAVACVTGGARGMGLAHAIGFARAGARVAILDIARDLDDVPYAMSGADDLERARRSIEAAGVDAVALQADVADETDVARAIATVVDRFGTIDVLVNNAGVNSIAPVTDLPLAAWDRILDVNLKGTFLCSREVAPVMIARGAGVIINVASGAGFVGVPKQAHYVAAKHGVVGLTKTLALELGASGIRVNAVSPTVVATPHSAGLSAANPGGLEEMKAMYGTFHPLTTCEILAPEDVTAAILWLASDAARYVTGTTLRVDAGFLAK